MLIDVAYPACRSSFNASAHSRIRSTSRFVLFRIWSTESDDMHLHRFALAASQLPP